MRKRTLIPLLTLFCTPLLGQSTINEQKDIRDYTDELGYYQKANRDLSDPRFMFHDETRAIDFGIGGKAQMESFYTFAGGLTASAFQPSTISIPNEPTNCFGTDISGSQIYIKSRAYWNGHKIIGYVRMGGGSDYKVSIKQVYVSIDGFSFGMIPTFFTDLEAGVKMYQAISTQSDVTQPLLGYTYRGKKRMEYALAFEKAAFDADMFHVIDIAYEYQKFPDITAHVKYRWNSGHIQLGAVLRNLSYWQKDEDTHYNNQGASASELGYGLSFSGNIKPANNLLLSWSMLGGKGIARYVPYFDNLNLEMGLAFEKDGTFKVMKPVTLACASLSAMYNWTDKLSSSFIGGYARSFEDKDMINLDDTKSMTFVAANLLCDISDFAYWGIEYFHGHRSLFDEIQPSGFQARSSIMPSSSDLRNGHANRIAVLIGFIF